MKHRMFEDVTYEELEYVIDCWVRGKHADRNRKIMKDRLFKGMTFERIAEEYDLSVRQVKNIIYGLETVISGKIGR